MKTVNLILPLEVTTVSDSSRDSRSDTVTAAEVTSAASEGQWSDSGAIAVRLRSDSSVSGATMEQ